MRIAAGLSRLQYLRTRSAALGWNVNVRLGLPHSATIITPVPRSAIPQMTIRTFMRVSITKVAITGQSGSLPHGEDVLPQDQGSRAR